MTFTALVPSVIPALLPFAHQARFGTWFAVESVGPDGRKQRIKRPFGRGGANASSADPAGWMTLPEAQAEFERVRAAAVAAGQVPEGVALPPSLGGLAVFLGVVDGIGLAGVDLDTCVDGLGVASWAVEVLAAVGQAGAEISPSGAGIKVLLPYRAEDVDLLRSAFALGDGAAGRSLWKASASTAAVDGVGGVGHAPGIEVYLGLRFFALTGQELVPGAGIGAAGAVGGVWADPDLWLGNMRAGALAAVAARLRGGEPLAEARGDAADMTDMAPLGPVESSRRVAEACALWPALAAVLGGDTAMLDERRARRDDRSAAVFVLVGMLKAYAGLSWRDCVPFVRDSLVPEIGDWYAEKGPVVRDREIMRGWRDHPPVPVDDRGQVAGVAELALSGAGRRGMPPLVAGVGAVDADGRIGAPGFGGWSGGDGVTIEGTAIELSSVPPATPLVVASACAKAAAETGYGVYVGTPKSAGTLVFKTFYGDEVWHRLLSQGADGRPVINTSENLYEIVDAAEFALLISGLPVFSRGASLMYPVNKSVPAAKNIRVPAPELQLFDRGSLALLLSRAANWQRYDARSKGMVRCNAPDGVVQALLSTGGISRMPIVTGTATAPLMRDDGSLVAKRGLDRQTGLWLSWGAEMNVCEQWVSEKPVKADAEAALSLLESLLVEFPFVTDSDRSVALSLILSLVARPALGAVPLHVFRASAPGTGKSYCVNVASVIGTGRTCSAMGWAARPEEQEKRLSAAMQGGTPLISIDNVNGDLESNTLSMMTSEPLVSIRPLGENMNVHVENKTVVTANGNQIRIVGDLARRTILSDLDAGMERPETRRFKMNPVEIVMRDRPRYVHAALTVVRAHMLAGLPGKPEEPLAGFADWSDLIRGALLWLGRADTAETTKRVSAAEPELVSLKNLLRAWADKFGTGSRESRGTTVAEIMLALGGAGGGMPSIDASGRSDDGQTASNLREAVMTVAGIRGQADARMLGNWLRHKESRVGGSLRFIKSEQTRQGGSVGWVVEKVHPNLQVVGGFGGS